MHLSWRTLTEEEQGDLHYKYEVTEDHAHVWHFPPRFGLMFRGVDGDGGPVLVPGGYAEVRKSGVTIKPGYRWDGASGPALDTMSFARASCLHDLWCQLMDLNIIEPSNKMWALGAKNMRAIAKEDGMGGFRRWWTFMGVRWGRWWR